MTITMQTWTLHLDALSLAFKEQSDKRVKFRVREVVDYAYTQISNFVVEYLCENELF